MVAYLGEIHRMSYLIEKVDIEGRGFKILTRGQSIEFEEPSDMRTFISFHPPLSTLFIGSM